MCCIAFKLKEYILHLIKFLAIVSTPEIDIIQCVSFRDNVYIIDHDMIDYTI